MARITPTLDEALSVITNGCTLLVPRETTGVAMTATRALVRRGVRDLKLVALPTSSLQADMLIGAGCVASIETSAVSLAEFGLAPRFTAAVTSGAIAMREATCPALHAEVQAAERGIPFMPLRGVLGSDILERRPDWKVIGNPFGEDDPILLLPALRAEVALFHAPFADRAGNVWIGRQRELAAMAHAAERTVVTVEKIVDENLFDDHIMAAGALSGFYVESVAVAERGAWPLPLPDYYGVDGEHMAEYARLAATAEGFAEYLDCYVHVRQLA